MYADLRFVRDKMRENAGNKGKQPFPHQVRVLASLVIWPSRTTHGMQLEYAGTPWEES